MDKNKTLTIYHNPRCSKSRATLAIISSRTNNFKVVHYLKQPLIQNEILLILKKLKLKSISIIRQEEKIWKENYKDKKLSNKEIIDILIKKPVLMKRPIVTKNNKAIIGIPPENVLKLLD